MTGLFHHRLLLPERVYFPMHNDIYPRLTQQEPANAFHRNSGTHWTFEVADPIYSMIL